MVEGRKRRRKGKEYLFPRCVSGRKSRWWGVEVKEEEEEEGEEEEDDEEKEEEEEEKN